MAVAIKYRTIIYIVGRIRRAIHTRSQISNQPHLRVSLRAILGLSHSQII